MSAEVLVQLRGVSKQYGEGSSQRPVLNGVDLAIRTGEFVVLLGKSGSGKSTLLNLVSGMDLPSQGEVQFQGKLLNQVSEEERTLIRRQQIGFVFQSFNLLPTLTVLENVRLPLELNRMLDSAHRAVALQLLQSVGLVDRQQEYPDRLSGGEQQRVAIARALVHQPLLLLADEPTGNLDEDTGREVLDLLEALCRERRRTVLVATHDREMVSRADRVLQMVHGHLVERPKLQVAR